MIALHLCRAIQFPLSLPLVGFASLFTLADGRLDAVETHADGRSGRPAAVETHADGRSEAMETHAAGRSGWIAVVETHADGRSEAMHGDIR